MFSQTAKRVLNAFAIGTLTVGLLLLIEDWQNIVNTVAVGDWTSLKTLAFAILGGAIGAGFRAIQAKVLAVPSPEPEENN